MSTRWVPFAHDCDSVREEVWSEESEVSNHVRVLLKTERGEGV